MANETTSVFIQRAQSNVTQVATRRDIERAKVTQVAAASIQPKEPVDSFASAPINRQEVITPASTPELPAVDDSKSKFEQCGSTAAVCYLLGLNLPGFQATARDLNTEQKFLTPQPAGQA
jgi:hypothetical protein